MMLYNLKNNKMEYENSSSVNDVSTLSSRVFLLLPKNLDYAKPLLPTEPFV